MVSRPLSQITFLYYSDLEPVAEFYESMLDLELVEDQGMAKIYRICGNAYLGIVDGTKGLFRPQRHSAVLLTLVVDDVQAWHDYLKGRGIETMSEISEDAHVRHFVLDDPGGYTLKVQSFLSLDVSDKFRMSASSVLTEFRGGRCPTSAQ